MKFQLETEADLNILAADMGWEYIPACDKAFLLLAEIEQIEEALAASAIPAQEPMQPQRGVQWLKGGQTHMFFMYVNGTGNWWRVKIHTHNGHTYAQRIRPDNTINRKTIHIAKPEDQIVTLSERHNQKAARQIMEEAGL